MRSTFEREGISPTETRGGTCREGIGLPGLVRFGLISLVPSARPIGRIYFPWRSFPKGGSGPVFRFKRAKLNCSVRGWVSHSVLGGGIGR